MLFKPFRQIISFALLCSIITMPNTLICAETTENDPATKKECVEAKKIAQRIYRSICLFFSSGNPQHVVNAQAYLNNVNPSSGKFKKLFDKIKKSLTTLINKMRSAKRCRLASLEKLLIDAFDRFGFDIKKVASEVPEVIGNTPETKELAMFLDRMPDNADREFSKLDFRRKKLLGMRVWRGF